MNYLTKLALGFYLGAGAVATGEILEDLYCNQRGLLIRFESESFLGDRREEVPLGAVLGILSVALYIKRKKREDLTQKLVLS